jgi:hypothetical protein
MIASGVGAAPAGDAERPANTNLRSLFFKGELVMSRSVVHRNYLETLSGRVKGVPNGTNGPGFALERQ